MISFSYFTFEIYYLITFPLGLFLQDTFPEYQVACQKWGLALAIPSSKRSAGHSAVSSVCKDQLQD
jgi:hypothetical protein